MHIEPEQLPKSVEVPYFYSTSTSKFIVMLIGSFGLYSVFWFYRNWILIRERTGKHLHPGWRALFSVIWAAPCCKFIKEATNGTDLEHQESPVRYGVAYSCLTVIGTLIPNNAFVPGLIVFALANACLIPINQTASRVDRIITTEFEENNAYSKWDKAILVVGGIFLIFMMSMLLLMMLPLPGTPSYKLR